MVHRRLRPRHHFTKDSSSLGTRRRLTRRNQYDAAGALSGARRRNDVTRCNYIDMRTQHIIDIAHKPEVHNASQRRHKRTESRRCTQVTCPEN